jgi:hypothetical protein
MTPEIASVTLYTDEDSVSGIDITYRVNGVLAPVVKHHGSSGKG